MGLYAMTGGATGIGAAIKEGLLAQGHEVIIVDVKDADIVADLSTSAGREHAINEITARAPGGLDGFIPCAGVGAHIQPFSLITRINYFGAQVLTERLIDVIAKKQGSILMISSNSAPMGSDREYIDLLLAGDEKSACERVDGLSGHDAYAGGKHALTVWMRRMTPDLAKLGVRINAIAPGFTNTPLTESSKNTEYAEIMQAFADTIPLGRKAETDDIAEPALFLLSDKARYITGSILFVDGGHDAMLRADSF